jgi:hypothetical protein
LFSHAQCIPVDSSKIIIFHTLGASMCIVAVEAITWATAAKIVVRIARIWIISFTAIYFALIVHKMIQFIVYAVHCTFCAKI